MYIYILAGVASVVLLLEKGAKMLFIFYYTRLLYVEDLTEKRSERSECNTLFKGF